MFDSNGTFIPNNDLNVFSYPTSDFYTYTSQDTYKNLQNLSINFKLDAHLLADSFQELTATIANDRHFSLLLNGPWLPFCLPHTSNNDIGLRLENELLPILHKSFTSAFPDSHFKAVIQDKIQLLGRLLPREETNYNKLIVSNLSSAIVGIYFPNAFNQFSVSSQVIAFNKIKSVSSSLKFCLSGPLEIASALIGAPSFLIHPNSYSPILIGSGAKHKDNRLISCFKSYGQHLEFWVLSNNLTFGVEQISEQWTGGLCFYLPI
jgi:hypothetical protein